MAKQSYINEKEIIPILSNLINESEVRYHE